jgi:hypothetical protein
MDIVADGLPSGLHFFSITDEYRLLAVRRFFKRQIMKHLLLTLLLYCTSISTLQAQDEVYLPTAVEGANWILLNSEIDYPNLAYLERIEGDTTVADYTYKKLYRHTIDYQDVQNGPLFEPPYELLPGRELIALLRDDIEERRVYGKLSLSSAATGFTVDTLLHDYSLTEGDTLEGAGFFHQGFDFLIITETGTEDRFGAIRLYQAYFTERFYEGVGSWEFGPTSGGSGLEIACCIFILKDYCVGDFADCGLVLSPVTELSQGVIIKTHPNPFTSNLSFTPPENQTAQSITVNLRDLTGRLLKEEALGDGLQWQTDDLKPGLYLATFTSGTRSATVKLVKQ